MSTLQEMQLLTTDCI